MNKMITSFRRLICRVIYLASYLLTRSATSIIIKIKSVLIDNRPAKTSKSEKKAIEAIKRVIKSVAFMGVPFFGWMRKPWWNHVGSCNMSSISCLSLCLPEEQWPSPFRAPRATRCFAHFVPTV